MSAVRPGNAPGSRSPGRGSWAWTPAACASRVMCGGSWKPSPVPMALDYCEETAAAAPAAWGGRRVMDAKQALFRYAPLALLATCM